MAYTRTLTGADTGLRLWAYPPHSLLAVWPFGLVGFYAALAIWSAGGVAALLLGARRFGFDWLETGIILTSPPSSTFITGRAAVWRRVCCSSPCRRASNMSRCRSVQPRC